MKQQVKTAAHYPVRTSEGFLTDGTVRPSKIMDPYTGNTNVLVSYIYSAGGPAGRTGVVLDRVFFLAFTHE